VRRNETKRDETTQTKADPGGAKRRAITFVAQRRGAITFIESLLSSWIAQRRGGNKTCVDTCRFVPRRSISLVARRFDPCGSLADSILVGRSQCSLRLQLKKNLVAPSQLEICTSLTNTSQIRSTGMLNDMDHIKTRPHCYDTRAYGTCLGEAMASWEAESTHIEPPRVVFPKKERVINPMAWGRTY